MSKSIIPLLNKIVGGLKKMFANLLLQFGTLFVPIGLIVAFFSYEFFDGWKAIVGILIGTIIFMIGFYAFFNALKMARLEQKAIEEKEDIREDRDEKRFNDLIKEIKGLRKDLRGKRDGKSKRA